MLFLSKRDYLSDQGLKGVVAWSGVVTLPMMEALIAGLLVSATKTFLTRSRSYWRYLGFLLMLLAATVLTISLFLFLVSWTAASQLGFVTYSSIRSFFTDLSSLLPVLTLSERALVISTFGSALILSLLTIAAAPIVSARKLLRWTAGLMLVLGIVIGGFRAGIRVLSHANALLLQRTFEAHVSPSATLVWAPLLFQHSQNYALTLAVSRRYGLETYAARIDRKIVRPNVLVFVVEALRAEELNEVVDGRPVIPTINALASKGLNFTHAYAPSNESAYSVTSMMSGLHALKYLTRDPFKKFDYPSNILRIYDLLSPVYRTAFVSSSNENWQNMSAVLRSPHLNYFFDATEYKDKRGLVPPDPADSGQYSAIRGGRLTTGNVDDAATTEQLLGWLSQIMAPDQKQPFFAVVSYQASHFPYEQGAHIPLLFKPDELSFDERSRLRFFSYPESLNQRMLNRYHNSLAYTDTQIARILQFLKEHGQFENTIVCVVGDHGELFHENGHVTHASRLYNKTLQVVFVIRGAKGLTGEYSAPVGTVDLGPILLNLVNMPAYGGFQGSVPPGLANSEDRPTTDTTPVFSTEQNLDFEDCVIVGRWKFLEQEEGDYQGLYDLKLDPMETLDRFSENPNVAQCLAATLHQFRNNQLAFYYNRPIKIQYFPPQYSLAGDPACRKAVFDH
jgi:glucan phosphoethanolaminetransferase (alkaline phosphatase superfamily)